jgi:hypothetical protein
MVSVNLDSFKSYDDFIAWLYTDQGRDAYDVIFDIIIRQLQSEKNKRHIPVIKHKLDGTVYTIDMNNLHFFLTHALKFYESLEEYEKCNSLLTIIHEYKLKYGNSSK